MTIVRVGATKKYTDGWEAAFGRGKKNSSAATKKKSPKKKSPKKKPAKKQAGAKKSPKKKSAKKTKGQTKRR